MRLSEVATITRGKLMGADQRFSSVGIDSRTLSEEQLFFAIAGENFDGHDYVAAVAEAGASGVVVEKPCEAAISQIQVADTTLALGELAQHWRKGFAKPVLGITGSNGKTSVTNLVRQIIELSGNPLVPRESFNNQWGVPLTLLRLRETHSHAVIEMGMNHPGELDYLTRLTAPTIVLINNAAAAHLEGLGDVASVAEAKAEIMNGVDDNGQIVLNADDAFFDYWRELAGTRKVVSFSIEGPNEGADLVAEDIETLPGHSRFQLTLDNNSIAVSLPLPGRHNVANALAAASVCYAAGVSIDDIASGLGKATGVSGRLQMSITTGGAVMIDDSFNANPASIKAAIDVLADCAGKRILILGAMAELGEGAAALHQKSGSMARQAGIERLMILADSEDREVRENARGYALGFGEHAELFDSVKSLIDALETDDRIDVSMLVKGSKSSYMGRVVNALAALEDAEINNNNNLENQQC